MNNDAHQKKKPFSRPPRGRLHVDRSGTSTESLRRRKNNEPLNGSSELLSTTLDTIANRSFSAYENIVGSFNFEGYTLHIHHAQKDPFAPPSHVSISITQEEAGFPEQLFDTSWKQTALEDHILRSFSAALVRHACHFADFIKGGQCSTTRPGQEILKRSAISIGTQGLKVRFLASFPARNRSVATREFKKLFFEAIPRVVRESLLYVSYEASELEAVVNLADDQHALREQMAAAGLLAFVANGAILPRKSGISALPLADAVPFESPESLKVSLQAPHAGNIEGMGIPQGVTLIIGGGYHGKSTLLKALQVGVYDHIAGDGREFVLCEQSAVKLRAEDGRSVRGTDISSFINNLPSKVDTTSFWTEDASGSTSQAASTAEALEAQVKTFLIDEDTSASNFMMRDELMSKLVKHNSEPITPFIDQLRNIYEKAGVSTILVAGSSGAFFEVADTIIQMDEYRAKDITQAARKLCAENGQKTSKRAEIFALPAEGRQLESSSHPLRIKTASKARKDDAARRGAKTAQLITPARRERIRTKLLGDFELRVGELKADLRFVEQLVDAEQTQALAFIVRWCMERDLFSRLSIQELVEEIENLLAEEGLEGLGTRPYAECGLALPRRVEIFACLNRLRPQD